MGESGTAGGMRLLRRWPHADTGGVSYVERPRQDDPIRSLAWPAVGAVQGQRDSRKFEIFVPRSDANGFLEFLCAFVQ